MSKIPLDKIFKAELIRDSSDPRLHVVSTKIKGNHRDSDVIMLCQKMTQIMKQYGGIGLAAPQIGINKRVCIIQNEQTGKVHSFINPRIVAAPQYDSNVNWDVEGCLSHPGITGEVARYKQIAVATYTLQHDKEVTFTVSGLMARILQHEIDHLDGILYPDLQAKGECRNIMFDLEGQAVLLEATRKNLEEGYTDPDVI